MGDTIITWNWPNWLTVGIMALTIFAVAGFAVQIYSKSTATAGA